MALSSRNNPQVFDVVRGIWVKATPEEIVRQSALKKMIQDLGYPRELIAVEKRVGELVQEQFSSVPDRRIDIVCFANSLALGFFPLLIIECKDEPFNQKAIEQVMGYNYFIKASYLAVVTPYEEITGHWDTDLQRYHFRKGFPSYEELLHCVNVRK